MPAGIAHQPAIVVVFNPEDDDPEVLARVIAAGGSRSRIRLVTEAGPRSPRPIDLSRDLATVRAHCEVPSVELVIFDNLGLALGKAARTEDATRDVLYRLTTIAKQTATTILAVRHTTKNARGHAVHAGSGRVALAGAARSVTQVGRAPDDPNLQVWDPVKVNGSPPSTPSLLYEITDTDLGPAINWLGTTEWSANDLMRTTTSDKAPKLTEAEQMLRDMLADGPRLRNEIKPEAVRRTIGWRTVEDAKANLVSVPADPGAWHQRTRPLLVDAARPHGWEPAVTAPPGPPHADQEPDRPTPGASKYWRTPRAPTPHPPPARSRLQAALRRPSAPPRGHGRPTRPHPGQATHTNHHVPAGVPPSPPVGDQRKSRFRINGSRGVGVGVFLGW